MKSPRLLFVSMMKELPSAGMIVLGLKKAGFDVATVSPPGSTLRRIKAVQRHYSLRRLAPTYSVVQAVDAWAPELLVCADDASVGLLHELHRQITSRGPLDVAAHDLVDLIEKSLGNPAAFDVARKKSELLPLAREMGLRCPSTEVITSPEDLQRSLVAFSFPAVLKTDETSGGSGVRIAADRQQALSAYRDLAIPKTWWSAVKNSLNQKSPHPLLTRLAYRRRAISLQEFVGGRPANCALVCWRGEILAGVSVEVLEVVYDNGPATVVRVIDHPEMKTASERLVRRLGISGFCGFDFVIDTAERAWLIEMNPRTTPISHIAFADGTHLPASLFARLAGVAHHGSAAPIGTDTIALFPGELFRSRRDRYLSSSYHDVPWDEPDFVRACLALKSTRRLRAQGRIRDVTVDQAEPETSQVLLDPRDVVLDRLRQLELR